MCSKAICIHFFLHGCIIGFSLLLRYLGKGSIHCGAVVKMMKLNVPHEERDIKAIYFIFEIFYKDFQMLKLFCFQCVWKT